MELFYGIDGTPVAGIAITESFADSQEVLCSGFDDRQAAGAGHRRKDPTVEPFGGEPVFEFVAEVAEITGISYLNVCFVLGQMPQDGRDFGGAGACTDRFGRGRLTRIVDGIQADAILLSVDEFGEFDIGVDGHRAPFAQ